MFAGCFSWCPCFQGGEKPKKSTPNAETKIVEVKVPAPATSQYIKASVKEVLSILQSASGLIPVPLLKESIDLSLKIIQLCEAVSAVEQRAQGLQERVGHLMVIILDHVTSKSEDGNMEMVVKAAKDIEADVEGLLRTLGSINKDLEEISAKKKWELVIFKEANANTLDDCMDRLSIALERFKLSNDLREYDVIRKVHYRLQRMADKVDTMAVVVGDIAVGVEGISGKMDNLTESFQEIYQRSLAQTPVKAPSHEEIPLKPEVFYGRDEMVDDIAQLLVKEETSRVCILGPGGMGKTSVSLAVVESPLVRERFPRSPVWVPCIGATTKAGFLQTLYIQLEIAGDKQITLEKIISELNISTDPRLIIFDNFETPMLVSSGGTQKGVEDILRKLAELKHVALLVTMRGSRPPCDIAIHWQTRNIQPTDEVASLNIFRTICPSSQNDPELPQLLTTLGNLPFAVTLMANLARDTGSTAKDLLSSWVESGPDMLPNDHDTSMNRSIKLSIDSDLVQSNSNAVLLLSILSLLPAGTTMQNLEWWASNVKKSIIPSAISTLMKTGLLVENRRQNSATPVLFVIPVVQSFVRHERTGDDIRRQVLQSCCHFVLDHACRWVDSTFPVNSKVLAGEDINIQSILVDSTMTQHTQLSDQCMDALIAFCWHRCDTKPTLDVVEYALSLARTYGKEIYVASALWCLGRTQRNLMCFELAYKYVYEAYQLFETLPSEDLTLRRLSAQCGIDLVEASRDAYKENDEVLRMAFDVESKCATLSAEIHGRSLVNVGCILIVLGKIPEALVQLERAKVVLTAVGDISSLSEAWQHIARAYRKQDQFPESINAMQEAWNLAGKSSSLKLEAEIADEFGEILISANRMTEGWKYLETALMKATIIGARGEIVYALLCMGYTYLCRKDYGNAYGAFEATMEKLANDEPFWRAMCKSNMEKIRQKQANPQMAIVFSRPFPVGGSRDFNPDNLGSSSHGCT